MDLALSHGDAIRLEIGDPDFGTPPNVVEAVRGACPANAYTPTAGTPQLRRAIERRLTTRGHDLSSHDVLVTAGAVGGIYLSMLSVLNPGDEVLIPDPSWPNFRMLAHMVGASVVAYPLMAADGFLPSVDDLRSLITPRTKAIVINTPSNPLGAVAPPTLLKEIAGMAHELGVWVISDETYEDITFEVTHTPTAVAADTPDNVISIYSFSKAYAMTGFRVGYASVPSRLYTGMVRQQEASLSCVSSLSQAAALAALDGAGDYGSAMLMAYRFRRDAAVQEFAKAGLDCNPPQGAFYLWFPTRSQTPSAQLARDLLRATGVAVAPGTAFGPNGEGWMRVSLATESQALITGCQRIARWLADRP